MPCNTAGFISSVSKEVAYQFDPKGLTFVDNSTVIWRPCSGEHSLISAYALYMYFRKPECLGTFIRW